MKLKQLALMKIKTEITQIDKTIQAEQEAAQISATEKAKIA